MLQTPGEVPDPLDDQGAAVLVEPADDGPVGAGGRHGGAGDGQAALGVVDQPAAARLGKLQGRVDEVADVPDAVLVRAVVHEQAQADVDLVGGQTRAVGPVHGREHVVDERRQLRSAECGDLPARPAKDLLAHRGHPAHRAALGLRRQRGETVDRPPLYPHPLPRAPATAVLRSGTVVTNRHRCPPFWPFCARLILRARLVLLCPRPSGEGPQEAGER